MSALVQSTLIIRRANLLKISNSVILLTHSVEYLVCTLSYKPSCSILLSNRIDYLLSVLISCFQHNNIVMLVKFHLLIWLSHLELDRSHTGGSKEYRIF